MCRDTREAGEILSWCICSGIEERATEKTSEKFILNMYKKGYTLDQIADVAETGVDEVEAIIKKKEPAMA